MARKGEWDLWGPPEAEVTWTPPVHSSLHFSMLPTGWVILQLPSPRSFLLSHHPSKIKLKNQYKGLEGRKR